MSSHILSVRISPGPWETVERNIPATRMSLLCKVLKYAVQSAEPKAMTVCLNLSITGEADVESVCSQQKRRDWVPGSHTLGKDAVRQAWFC